MFTYYLVSKFDPLLPTRMSQVETDTKTKILDIAQDMLQDKGFNAFSYQHISSLLGIKNAAIHYHYPSKENLGIAIYQRSRKRFNATKEQARQEAYSSWQKLDVFLDIFRSNLNRDQKVCLVGALGNDYFTLPPGMQQEGRLMANEVLDWLTEVLDEGRTLGNFAFKGEPYNKALTLCSSMVGALQLARITDNNQFYAIIEQLKKDLSK